MKINNEEIQNIEFNLPNKIINLLKEKTLTIGYNQDNLIKMLIEDFDENEFNEKQKLQRECPQCHKKYLAPERRESDLCISCRPKY